MKKCVYVENSTRSLSDVTQRNVESELKSAKKRAISACRDFAMYHKQYPDEYKGFDDALIDKIKNAKTESEIRDLLRKARAV